MKNDFWILNLILTAEDNSGDRYFYVANGKRESLHHSLSYSYFVITIRYNNSTSKLSFYERY